MNGGLDKVSYIIKRPGLGLVIIIVHVMMLIILNLDNQSALHTLMAMYVLAAEFPENMGINQIILYLCNL